MILLCNYYDVFIHKQRNKLNLASLDYFYQHIAVLLEWFCEVRTVRLCTIKCVMESGAIKFRSLAQS